MDGTGAGTVIMLAVAAVLWFVYLVPTWLRRREYLATERTATRLQQTMRVLAETAEVPEEVRVAVSAREAARQERLLRAQQRRADAMAARQAAAIRRETPAAPHATLAPDVLRRRRMRRTRLGASLLMISATVTVGIQIFLVATTGWSIGGFFVLVAAITAGGAAIATQRRLDRLSMPRTSGATSTRTAVQVGEAYAPAPARPASAPWTPVEVPRPLYLSRPAPESAVVQADLAASLRAAAAASEAALRAAQESPEVAPLRPAAPTSSKYARMGLLDADATESPDLDEVLRRRRSAG